MACLPKWWLPRLQMLQSHANGFGNAGMQALCESLGPSAAPSLRSLGLSNNKIIQTSSVHILFALGEFKKKLNGD